MNFSLTIFISIILFDFTFGSPTKDRLFEKKLSDVEHHLHDGNEHNSQYDHEAFLGKEESKQFDNLSPEESVIRLSKIIDKIDKNFDGKVTRDELSNWMTYVDKSSYVKDADIRWKEFQLHKDDKLVWEVYQTKAIDSSKDPIERNQTKMKDERRWKYADKDGDNVLTKSEFFSFLHPEKADDMKDIVVQEVIDEIDTNRDGFLDLDEYVKDMWIPTENETVEPDWVTSERDVFAETRDQNKDGKLDRDEVRVWITPEVSYHVQEETDHLFNEADVDKNDILSREEILSKHDIFVGSQATDYGEAIRRSREEL